MNDFNRELSEYAKSFEFSEEEFRETEDRLNLLNHLKAKYGRSIEAVLAYCDEKSKDYRNWQIMIHSCRTWNKNSRMLLTQ